MGLALAKGGQMIRRFKLKAPKPPKLVENDVEQQALDLLRWRGYWVLRIHTGKFKTADGRWITGAEEGTPDYAVLHHRYPGFLMETKRPKGEPSTAQLKKHFEIHTCFRIPVAVIDGLDALKRWLEQHEKGAS